MSSVAHRCACMRGAPYVQVHKVRTSFGVAALGGSPDARRGPEGLMRAARRTLEEATRAGLSAACAHPGFAAGRSVQVYAG